ARGEVRRRPRRAGLHVERPARGDRGRAGARRLGGRRRAAHARPRLAAASRRPLTLLLEEREVAARAPAPEHRPAPLLGALRLPQRRRLLERAALRLLAAPLSRRPAASRTRLRYTRRGRRRTRR